MRFTIVVLTILLAFSGFNSNAQNTLGSLAEDESHLYAQTKQVNQFFRRFNNEEDFQGNRYYPGDELYRSDKNRDTYLEMLFDKQASLITKDLKKEFINQIKNKKSPVFLAFHGDLWFAELAANFTHNQNLESMMLFMQLEPENLGYKWVISNVYYNKFLKYFYKGDKSKISKAFLHPLSHELDFMNLRKAFKDPAYLEYYATKNYKPDYRSLLFYEIKKGNMKFESVGQLKFHFFQVDGWYFEVSYFNRPGGNSGWLISKLYKISEKEKTELLQFYLP